MPHTNTKVKRGDKVRNLWGWMLFDSLKPRRLCAAIFSSVIASRRERFETVPYTMATKQSRFKNEIAIPAFGGFAMTRECRLK